MNNFSVHIASLLALPQHKVANTIELLDNGNTIPFISRYRKERTGGLNEVEIAAISEQNDRFKEMAKRKDTIVKTIAQTGQLTDELKARIDNCWENNVLEDIYLPYRPKRRTKAQIAREKGLEPLAQLILFQRENHPTQAAARFIKDDIANVEEAIKGAQDIIAETVSEDEHSRNRLRSVYNRSAQIRSQLVKSKASQPGADRYKDYFDMTCPLDRCASHRLLAMRRGENEGVLKVSITADDAACLHQLHHLHVKGHGPCSRIVEEAVDDAFRRLLKPAMETEYAQLSKQKADTEAIAVFAENLRQLLLAAPLGQKAVLAIDPGFRTGCKTVCLDPQGNLLHHDVIFPHPPHADVNGSAATLRRLVNQYQVEAIAIGNGTASRETTDFVNSLQLLPTAQVFMVSEDGASVYSASKVAREEFPQHDVTVRGAVSIGRRLMDPLAELVKIDPKSIGVGQYQHDVDQNGLKRALDLTVECCVNGVGVNLNTASRHLLTYVSGLGPVLAQNIVDYRSAHGAFTSRNQLRNVPRLGPAAFRQCAGFLRIPGAENPLDNTAVHPERYGLVERMARDAHCNVEQLVKDRSRLESLDLIRYVSDEVGMPTLTDILAELEKPGRDPRSTIEAFAFDPDVHTLGDLHPGMELPGIVTNITHFGVFVDVGVHHDGLVHISQLSHSYVADPAQIVRLHQHVRVKVVEVDEKRERISLTMKF